MTQRSNFSRRTLLGSLAAAGTLGAASCTGGSSGGGTTEEGGVPEPSVSCEIPDVNVDDSELDLSDLSGEITFMTQGLKGTFDDFFTDLISDFESANPGTSITWTTRAAPQTSTR